MTAAAFAIRSGAGRVLGLRCNAMRGLAPGPLFAFAAWPLARPARLASLAIDRLVRFTAFAAVLGRSGSLGRVVCAAAVVSGSQRCLKANRQPSADGAVRAAHSVQAGLALHELTYRLGGRWIGRRHGRQCPRRGQAPGFGRRRQQPVVADALEADGRNMLNRPVDELGARQLGDGAVAVCNVAVTPSLWRAVSLRACALRLARVPGAGASR